MATGLFDDIPDTITVAQEGGVGAGRQPPPRVQSLPRQRQRRSDPQQTAPTPEEPQPRTFAAPQLADRTPSSGLFDDIPTPDDPIRRLVDRRRDVDPSFRSGVVRGAVGLVSLPGTVEQLGRMGYNWAQRQMGSKREVDAAPHAMNRVYQATGLPGSTFQDVKGAVERNITGPLHQPKTTAGEYAQTIGEFTPGLAMGGGGLAQRAITNVAAPAVASETAGQMTKGTPYETPARIAGGFAGSFLSGRINPGDPVRAQQVDVLRREGVPVTAGQAKGPSFTRWAESVAADVPLSGAQRINTNQAEQFTRAALRRAGVDANRATPEVLDQAFTRLGQQFDNIALQTRIAPARWSGATRARVHRQINDAVADYAGMVNPNLQAPVVNQIADGFRQALATGVTITGPQYQSWRSQIDRLARGTPMGDPAGTAIRNLQGILDDMVQHSWTAMAPGRFRAYGQQMRDQYTQARREYRNLLAIERAATAAGEGAANGLISPSALRNAVKTMHGQRNYSRGRGDLAELSRAGEAVLKPLPQSGTAPRAMVSGLAGSIGLGASGGNPLGGLAGAMAPTLGAWGVLNPATQYVLRNGLVPPLANLPRGSPLSGVYGGYVGTEP